jgi:hypothetical protein
MMATMLLCSFSSTGQVRGMIKAAHSAVSLTHMPAIMHRSRKPFIVSWVTRAAFYAIDHLQDAWSEQLVWPIEVLTPPPLRGAALQPTSAFPPLHLSHDVEGLDSNLFADSSMDFSSASVAGFTDGDGIEPSPYLPAST